MGLDLILGVCGGLITLAGGAAVIWKIVLPHITAVVHREIATHMATLQKLEEDVTELMRRTKNDYETLQRSAKTDKAIIKSLLALLEHAETGNSTGIIKQTKGDLQKHLIEYI